jgi:hypothetical protein
VRRGAEDRIKVLYDDQPVDEVRLLTVRIVCSGTVEIKEDDYVRPLSVDFGSRAVVLSPEVAKTVPDDLAPRLTVHGTRLEIEPLLLNPGDTLEIAALVSGMSNVEHLDGRISGVTKFIDLQTDAQTRRLFRRATTLASPAFALAAATAVGVLSVTIGALFATSQHTETRIVLDDSRTLCGKVLRVGTESVLVRLAGTGQLHTSSIHEVRAIKEDDC